MVGLFVIFGVMWMILSVIAGIPNDNGKVDSNESSFCMTMACGSFLAAFLAWATKHEKQQDLI